MRQVSDEGITGTLPSRWVPGDAPLAPPRRRRSLLRAARRPEPLSVFEPALRVPPEASGAGLARGALRAFFQALRAAAACLRARLASRLASFTRLRACFSSSFAIRTRCLATSACSRARSSGSIGSSRAAACAVAGGTDVLAPLPAPDGGAPALRLSLAVFPIRNRVVGEGRPVSHN